MNIIKRISIFIRTRIEYGIGISKTVGLEAKLLGGKKVLIVTDKNLIELGLLNNIFKSLEEQKIDYEVFNDVEMNPRDYNVMSGVKKFKSKKCNVILCVGGGSPIDVGKGISIVASHGGNIKDYETKELLSYDESKTLVRNNTFPIIAVPTTSGSGSEASPYAVIIDTNRKYKMAILTPYIYPVVALVDPELFISLPGKIVAEGGMDVISHAVEAYTCLQANPFSDAFALQTISMVGKNLREAVYDQSNIFARGNMALASIIGGISASLSNTHLSHAMAEALGSVYDISHGLACGYTLPVVMKYNHPVCYQKYVDIARTLEFNNNQGNLRERSVAAINAIQNLIDDISLKKISTIIKVKPDLKLLSKKTLENIAITGNPRNVNYEDIIGMFNSIFSK